MAEQKKTNQSPEPMDSGCAEGRFDALDMKHIISGPIQTAHESQSQISQNMAEFLSQTAIDKNKDEEENS